MNYTLNKQVTISLSLTMTGTFQSKLMMLTNWAVNVWQEWAAVRNKTLLSDERPFSVNFCELSVTEMNFWLSRFVLEIRKKSGDPYPPESLYSLICGLQPYLLHCGSDTWFTPSLTHTLTHSLTHIHTHAHSLTHSHTHTCSLTHTHTHTLTDSHTHTLWFLSPNTFLISAWTILLLPRAIGRSDYDIHEVLIVCQLRDLWLGL